MNFGTEIPYSNSIIPFALTTNEGDGSAQLDLIPLTTIAPIFPNLKISFTSSEPFNMRVSLFGPTENLVQTYVASLKRPVTQRSIFNFTLKICDDTAVINGPISKPLTIKDQLISQLQYYRTLSQGSLNLNVAAVEQNNECNNEMDNGTIITLSVFLAIFIVLFVIFLALWLAERGKNKAAKRRIEMSTL